MKIAIDDLRARITARLHARRELFARAGIRELTPRQLSRPRGTFVARILSWRPKDRSHHGT